MAHALRVFVLTASLVVLSAAQIQELQPPDYLEIARQQGGPECGKLISSGLTAAQQKEIVDVHNKHRMFVASGKEKRGKPGPQPPAKKMPPLEWSDELAKSAQAWADTCHWGHESDISYGQNLYKETANQPLSFSKMITEEWYDEVQDFDANQVKSLKRNKSPPDVGHYTQIVWAETTQVGCGFSQFKQASAPEYRYLVCNYSPAGNIIGRPVY